MSKPYREYTKQDIWNLRQENKKLKIRLQEAIFFIENIKTMDIIKSDIMNNVLKRVKGNE